jgi:hypothetical protein
MNRVSQRMFSHILITILGWPCLLLAGSASGMSTLPQKPTQSNAIGSNALILKAYDIRAAPDSNSTMLLGVEKGAQVRLLLSQCGWSQISNAGHTGWVRVLSVRKQGNDGIGLSDLAALVRKPQGKVVAVAGTRGLDEEQFSLASYDSAEIELLRGHVISREEAKQYAQAAELHARDVTYIAEPNQSQFSAQ